MEEDDATGRSGATTGERSGGGASTAAAVEGLRVTGFDHLVLRCADVQRSLEWYSSVLGLRPLRVEQWRGGLVPFPSVRVDEGTIIDLIPGGGLGATPNLDHLCLVVEQGGVDAVVATAGRLRIVDGPAERFGARGMGRSVYVLDPDENVVELRSYG